MYKTLLIAVALSFTTVVVSEPVMAADKAEKKLSKKERKALAAKHNKMGRMASMCIGSLAMSTLKDESIRETPKFKASEDFWTAKLEESVSHVKEKKREKLRGKYRDEGSAALTKYGNGNIVLGGKKAAVICNLVEAENFEGPTTTMLMSQ